MARIRTQQTGDILRVVVAGRLSAGDIGRLEHACAPALVASPAPLFLDLRRLTSIDDIALAMLTRIAQRGARVVGATDVLPRGGRGKRS